MYGNECMLITTYVIHQLGYTKSASIYLSEKEKYWPNNKMMAFYF